MLTNTQIKVTNIITWVVSILLAVILVCSAIFSKSNFIIINETNITGAATLLGTFDFTMTGFIAAVGAYIISLTEKTSFLKWKQKGYVFVFYHFYAQSIIFLLISFILCMLSLVTTSSTALMILKYAVYLLPLNILHIILITVITLKQMQKD